MCIHGGFHNVRQIFPPLRASGSRYSNLLFFSFVGNATQEGTNNTSAAFIGVVGGLILSPLYLLYLIPLPPGQLRSDYAIGLTVLIILPYSTIIGAIGSSILLYCRVDLGGIDISYAALTGFLGGIILAIPAIFGSFLFCLLLTSVNSFIWSAIMKGVQWVHIKLTETWLDRSHSHSYGSRGGDPEINIGFQIPPGRD